MHILKNYLKTNTPPTRIKDDIYANGLSKIILKKKGYSRILIESGLTLINFLLINKFLKFIYIFKSNSKLGKYGLNYSSPRYIKKINLKNLIKVNLFGDKLYREKLK